MRALLIVTAAILVQGCEFHASPDARKYTDTSMRVPDEIAYDMIVKRLDAEKIEYWIDDDGNIRYSKVLGLRVDGISEKVFEHRHGGAWVQYGGEGCDYKAAMIAVLEERGIEYLIEPSGADGFEDDFIHWYPTKEFTKDAISAEVDKRACSETRANE